MTRSTRNADIVARLSLVVAALALYPSVAPFTPAVLLSGFALIGAGLGGVAGAWRTSTVAALLSLTAIVGSPIFPFARAVERWMDLRLLYLGGTLAAMAVGLALWLQYRRASSGAARPDIE